MRSFAVCAFIAAVIALCACLLPARVALAATADIELSADTPTANIPFAVQGMLPGDTESLNAQVKVTHADANTVYFKAENLEDAKNLSDVLELSVADRSTGKVITTASVAELAQGKAVEISLDASKQTSMLDWDVTATLPSSAGNEYQNASCSLDLVWSIQAEDDATPTPPVNPSTSGGLPGFIGGLLPATGESALWILLFVALCMGALAMFRTSGRLAQENAAGGGLTQPSSLVLETADTNQTLLTRALAYLNRRKPLVALLIAIALLLAAASLAWALFWAQARLPHNTFQTGTVSIDLNGGKPVFGKDIEMEPGRTLVEDFTVTNTGSASCYYRVRLEDLKGDLAPALNITIKRGDEVLYQGNAIDLERTAAVCERALGPSQTDTLTAIVTMDEASGNGYQGKAVTFDVAADATQVRNNEGREF